MCILYFEKWALQLISEYLIIFNLCPYDTCKQRPNHPNKNIPLQLISEYLIIFNLCPYDTCKQRPNHPNKNIHFFYCGGQLIPYVQITLEKAGPNIQSHMYRLHKKGPDPISSPRIREYPRTTSKKRDESCTPKRSKECL